MSQQLSQLLLQIQSGDKSVREPAEVQLQSEWLEGGGDRPAQLLVGLAELATQGAPEQRGFAAVILRRYATRLGDFSDSWGPQATSVFGLIGEPAQQRVRDLLLAGLLAEEQPPFARRKISDTIAELAHPTQWPGLWDSLVHAASSHPDPSVREAAFRVLGGAPELLPSDSGVTDALVPLLNQGFSDSSEAVRTSATSTYANIFVYVPRASWPHLKPLLPPLLNVMEPLRSNHHEQELTSVLESLVTLAEIAPRMFSPVFSTLVDFAMAVAGDEEFDESPRLTALELMAQFADGAPTMCSSDQHYISSFLPMLLKLLTSVGEDDEGAEEWQNMDDFDLYEEAECLHREAKLAIDRLSLSLGGEVVVPQLFKYLPSMLTSSLWRERLAGLMALSNAAEGCREQMLPELEQILNAVVPLLNDVHCRVQWSACNALGQLSTDLAPELQTHFGDLVLPGLISMLRVDATFKVQAHAAAALVNFSDGATKEIMDPHLDALISRLLILVQSPKRYVQEQALTTIAMVADSAQTLFAKYYSTLMPLVLEILDCPLPFEYRLLKAKAIECATLIALAVGREVFTPHMAQLGQRLLSIQSESQNGVIDDGNGMEHEDPCAAYLVQSWGRLCRVVGADFVPFLPAVIPPLLESAKAEEACHILDLEQAESLRDSEGWEVLKYGNQWIGINTASFEEKASAIELLHVYPHELGAQFWPYVGEIASDVVLPSLRFHYSLRVRAYACQLIPHLVYVAHQHHEANELQLFKTFFDALVKGPLRNERESAGMHAEVFMAIQRVIDMLGRVLDVESLNTLCTLLVEIVSGARKRLELATEQSTAEQTATAGANPAMLEAVKAAALNTDDFEEEEEEEESEREDEEVIDASNRLVHSLLRAYGGELLDTHFSAVAGLVPVFLNSQSQDARLWALEVLGDLAEFGKQRAVPAIESNGFIELVLHAISPAGGAVRAPIEQAASVLCLGKIVLWCSSKFALGCLEPLLALAQSPETRSLEGNETRERCCGTIARILRVHGPTNLSESQFSMACVEWLKTMPVTQEADGAPYPYMFLAELIEKKHEVVGQHYDLVFVAIVQALVAGTLVGKPAEIVVEQTKGLIAALPEDKRMAVFNKLNEAEKHVVQQVFA